MLLLIDNVNIINKVEIDYLDSLSCRVLLTSRNQIDRIKPVTIDVMPPEKCRELYREHSKDAVSDDAVLDEIIKLAACHTLAVELLAKTQKASGMSASELRDELKKSEFALNKIGETVDHQSEERRFIEHFAKVFDLAGFETDTVDAAEAEKRNEELRVLRRMSLLAYQPVAKTDLKAWFAMDDLNAINRLIKKGWLTEATGTERPGVVMHPVIAEVVRYKKPPNLEIAKPLVTALRTKLQMEPTEVFTEKLPFMPHAMSVATFFKEITDSAALASLFHNMGRIDNAQANYAQALEWYEKALPIFEKVPGKEHPATAGTYNNIALVYQNQGEYDKALVWYQKALPIYEKELGKEHPFTATTYNNMANVYYQQGDYGKALEWHEKALAIKEKVLGKEHPDTAATYNNMAAVYRAQGEYEKALEWYQKDLAISEKVLGKEHPDTAVTYNNIASLHYHQGDFTWALERFGQALRIHHKVLGPNHPHFLQILGNAEITHAKSGRAESFHVWLEKTLAGE